jgi:hypothetical protein
MSPVPSLVALAAFSLLPLVLMKWRRANERLCQWEPHWLGFYYLYLGLALASVVVRTRLLEVANLPAWHAQMVAGGAKAPNQYRIFTPFVVEGLRRAFGLGVVDAYAAQRFFWTLCSLCLCHMFLRGYLSSTAAGLGSVVLAATLPFTYQGFIQETDAANLAAFLGALLLMQRRRDVHLLWLVPLATLNRETVAVIPVIYALVRAGDKPVRRAVLLTLLQLAAFFAVYAGLRAIYGQREYYCALLTIPVNFFDLLPTEHLILLYGPMWVLALVGWRSKPLLLRRALLVLAPFIALHYVIALVYEPRLFLPFAPVVIAMALLTIVPDQAVSPPVGE